MIRMVQSTSAGHAKAYFSEALSQSDYYINDQELQGKMEGRLVERLGLTGTATKETFFALAENLNPMTGAPLTPRTKEDRTVGYDINFHCPKSVSIVHALSKDDHIREAFEESVAETMQDIEKDTQTRVRKGGKYADRKTGELIWSSFTHQTARPVADHTPDPHLHSHCFVFNVTWDETEQQCKAAKFKDIKRDMPYYQARFRKRLADKLMERQYRIRLTDNSFEIEGVPQRVIDLFSKRTDEIGRVAKEKNITSAKELDKLGARTRARKQKGLGMAELKSAWRKQIHDLGDLGGKEEKAAVRFAPKQEMEKTSPKDCVDHALAHSFERASVMADRRILQTAYQYALGDHTVSLDDITKQFESDDRLIHIPEGSRTVCTTREVLREEQQMVALARQGKGRMLPLYDTAPASKLTGQQAAAVKHILTTKDRVSLIRGAAGTGKTTLMGEAVRLMEKAGKKVTVVAPTAQASRGVLKEEGFAGAETVARLLVDTKLQEGLDNQILWVDEAGLMGTHDMKRVLQLATDKNARLILGGDTRQHASVVRGDALRILNTVGDIQAAEVSKIYRQKNTRYLKAVEELSKGEVGKGFEQLDGMGAIKAVDTQQPNAQLVDDYLRTVKKGKSALVISPTHKQGDAVTDDIRLRLRKEGLIGKKEIAATRLDNLNLTAAEKADWRNYVPGQVIQFNQNTKGIKRGSAWTVKEAKDKEVQIADEKGNTTGLPYSNVKAFDVFEKKAIGISKGDRIQITRNGFDKEDKRLNNGRTLDVVAVSKQGRIKLQNKTSKATYEVDKDFGHLTHAHCITSQAAQGKTVDEVFIAQPAATFPATDARQFYVSVSRGRDAAHIYTDDKVALLEYASELGERQSALELVARKTTHRDYVHHNIREQKPDVGMGRSRQPDKTYERTANKDYEPRV